MRCSALPVSLLLTAVLGVPTALPADQSPADVILHNGRIVTVDDQFQIAQAVAWRGNQILQVGDAQQVLKTRGPQTEVIDLAGRMVLPGLIDSHVHAANASMHEFDHVVPEMETIVHVLDYIRSRAEELEDGQWIWVNQVFITRLAEQRYPTRSELDSAAPGHPVVFSTGPDAMLNTMALKLSGIDKDFQIVGAGKIERDPQTGEPTGILRNAKRVIKGSAPDSGASEQQRSEQLLKLLRDYAAVGLTTVADRNASSGVIDRYQRLYQADQLPVRIMLSHSVDASARLDAVKDAILRVAQHPLRQPDPMLRIVGIKTFLDGGMLTGSAYMREPWGVSRIYGIDDPRYRGLLFIEPDDLTEMVRVTVESDLQFTAHSVGDGAVHALLDAYAEVNQSIPVARTRPCITHSNFMSREAIEQMKELGVVADIQPAWLFLDARTLQDQFGYERLRYFQPLQSLFAANVKVGGGSDHMQKIGSLRSVNPYNPFLGMWITITRQAKRYEGRLHPEEALTREQAIRFYTTNNAYILFLEEQVGSIEPGKLADLIVIDRDLLTCPVEQIKETQVVRTYVDGELVYQAPAAGQ